MFFRNCTIVILLGLVTLFSGCHVQQDNQNNRLNIVTTTTMSADLVKAIGGELVDVNCLMGPGIDPHLYQASAGDVTRMQNADIILYNGFHLEGKMGDLFSSLNQSDKQVICLADGLKPSLLIASETNSDLYDPHIWYNVLLWKEAAVYLADHLSLIDPEHASIYENNLSSYLVELDELNEYIHSRVAELPEDQRVLITAHDAFRYFGTAYGFEVIGLQGISTDAEAGTSDVSTLAGFIAKNQIKSIFIESSVPPRTIEALQAATNAKGFQVIIGGELYSDSLGGEGSGAESYLLTFRANIDTIVDALKP